MALRVIDVLPEVERILGGTPSTSTINSPARSDALTIINDVLALISQSDNFRWLRRKFSIVTEPVLTTGTATVTNASDAVTLTNEYTENLVGRLFYVTGEDQPYTVVSGTGTAGIRIAPAYQGTSTAGAAYTIYEPRVILPFNLKFPESPAWRESPGQEVHAAPRTDYSEEYRNPAESGQPIEFKLVEDSMRAYATGTATIAATGDSTGTLATTATNNWLYRWFHLTAEPATYYEITGVNGTTLSFRPKYNGSLAGTASAIAVDPAGSPVIQLANYPTTAEIINFNIYVWPPRYSHNNDPLCIPDNLRKNLLDGARYLASMKPYSQTENPDIINFYRDKFYGDDAKPGSTPKGLEAARKEDRDVDSNVLSQRQPYFTGPRGPYPKFVNPKIVTTS